MHIAPGLRWQETTSLNKKQTPATKPSTKKFDSAEPQSPIGQGFCEGGELPETHDEVHAKEVWLHHSLFSIVIYIYIGCLLVNSKPLSSFDVFLMGAASALLFIQLPGREF